MKFLFSICLLFFFNGIAKSGTVDTISVFSNAMHKSIKAVVIKPDSYRIKTNRFPVVYVLHGYDGNFSNWITYAPELKAYADIYQILIICPDGATSSWYFDSPVDIKYRYETHIAKEVVNYVDRNFRTIANKNHRAITGLSMGGHGALFLGFRHSAVFGAAGSMSGGVDLKESKNRFDISKRIGDTVLHAAAWHNLTVINLIEKYANTKLKIIFDCGNKDIFIDGNRRLHQKMLRLKIEHVYNERPGMHNWDYWRGSIGYQLLYFSNFFKKNTVKK